MEALGATLITVRLVLLALLVVGLATWLARAFLRRRRYAQLLFTLEQLANTEVMGLKLRPGFRNEPAALTLRVADAPSDAASMQLDTSTLVEPSARLAPFTFGLAALDARLVVRVADDTARRGIEAARRGALVLLADFFEGEACRFNRIAVTGKSATFAFGPSEHRRLERLLPALCWVTKALLSAAWWLPPSPLPLSADLPSSAFRGGPDFDASAAIWFVEGPTLQQQTGPFSLEQLIALLQRGRISWLTRASNGDTQPLTPLHRLPALRSVCFSTSSGEASTAPAVRKPKAKPPKGRGRRLFDFLQYDLFLLVLLAVAALASCQAGEDLQRAGLGQRSSTWPTTTAEIVGSRLAVRKTDDGQYYWPSLRYRYSVDGKALSGQRWRYRYVWRFDGYSGDLAMVKRALAAYPVGKRVLVAYDPQDPRESVLEPGAHQVELVSGVIKASIAGLCLLLIAAAALARSSAARARRRLRRALESTTPP